EDAVHDLSPGRGTPVLLVGEDRHARVRHDIAGGVEAERLGAREEAHGDVVVVLAVVDARDLHEDRMVFLGDEDPSLALAAEATFADPAVEGLKTGGAADEAPVLVVDAAATVARGKVAVRAGVNVALARVGAVEVESVERNVSVEGPESRIRLCRR